jgi:cholera toxin transcriptional activator
VNPLPHCPVFVFGAYSLNTEIGELRKYGQPVRLQQKVLLVLVTLAESRGELVTRKELHKRLWPDDTLVDFEGGLNTAMGKLRKALRDDAGHPRFIETIRGRGYRLLIPVEVVIGQSSAVADSRSLAMTHVSPSPPAEPSIHTAPGPVQTESRPRHEARRVRDFIRRFRQMLHEFWQTS